MAVGYFLRLGDKTTCGGQILTGDRTFIWYGVAGAREGDRVSCGKHPGVYEIYGGVYDIWDEERPWPERSPVSAAVPVGHSLSLPLLTAMKKHQPRV